MQDLSRPLRALALLLDYPGEDMQAHLAEIRAILSPLESGQSAERESLLGLIDHMAATDLMDLQAEFVACNVHHGDGHVIVGDKQRVGPVRTRKHPARGVLRLDAGIIACLDRNAGVAMGGQPFAIALEAVAIG